MNPEIVQYLTEFQLRSFYEWWQFIVSLVACLALLSIWWHIGKRQKDLGQVWLALSLLCWTCSGLIDIYYSNQIQQKRIAVYQDIHQLIKVEKPPESLTEQLKQHYQDSLISHSEQTLFLNGWQSILSLFNSLLILLALPWFRYIPGRLEALIKSKYWYYIIGFPLLFSLLHTITGMITGNDETWIRESDLYYGVFTLVFLGAVLWESFSKRRLTFLAWLSILIILFTLIAQIFKIFNSNFNLFFSAIFKTSLIMLFFALALSWVKELAQNIIPQVENLLLSFKRQKNEKGKMDNLITIKGFPGKADRKVYLSPGMYDLLFKFAHRKTQSEQDDWLEIKPKNDMRSSKTYDINDYNEIRRLINAMLDELFGKGNWTKEIHFLPLKDCLFEMSEKRERKIRLRIPLKNLSF